MLVEGQYSKCDEMDKVGAILNWLGPKSFEVYEDLAMEPGKDKKKCEDVLNTFGQNFKPTQSLFQNWYQLGGLYSDSCKNQGDFMRQLKEVAKECSFTNSDEFIKFLFLTHNQNSRVRDTLLDRMKATDTPAQCLAIAKTVESTIETEKLSKNFLQSINKPESTEVDAVSNRKGFKGPDCKQSRGQRQCSHSGGKTKCRTVDLLIPQGNVQPMEKSASCARRRDISNNSVGVFIKTGIKAVAVITGNPEGICMMWISKKMNCSSWKTMIQLM